MSVEAKLDIYIMIYLSVISVRCHFYYLI